MRKYLTEFIGTFFLLIAIFFTGNPIAIGSMLMVMIYAGGHISGAHYNPAVTLGVWLRGKCDTSDVLPYMVAQIAGGALAALIAMQLLPADKMAAAPFAGVTPALIVEFLGAFALVYVILNSATAKGTEGNSFYGLAIGFTVLSCAYAFGGISGGAFNPAVAIGAGVGGVFAWSNIWVHIVANLAAGAAAAFVFKFASGEE